MSRCNPCKVHLDAFFAAVNLDTESNDNNGRIAYSSGYSVFSMMLIYNDHIKDLYGQVEHRPNNEKDEDADD